MRQRSGLLRQASATKGCAVVPVSRGATAAGVTGIAVDMVGEVARTATLSLLMKSSVPSSFAATFPEDPLRPVGNAVGGDVTRAAFDTVAGSKNNPLRTAFAGPSFVNLMSTFPEIVQFM